MLQTGLLDWPKSTLPPTGVSCVYDGSSTMLHTVLIAWLDPTSIIAATGPWALGVVALIVFAETGLLIGFLFPGGTLLFIFGLLCHAPCSSGSCECVWFRCVVGEPGHRGFCHRGRGGGVSDWAPVGPDG